MSGLQITFEKGKERNRESRKGERERKKEKQRKGGEKK